MEFKSSEFIQQKPECKDQQTPINARQHENHQTFWNSLTTDTNILNTLQEYQIDFTMKSYQYKSEITPIPKNMEKAKVIQDEINSLLQKQAILPVQSHPRSLSQKFSQFPRNLAECVQLSILNLFYIFIETINFKTETLQTALNLIKEGDFLINVDLNDAYFSITIHHLHRKYLRFFWRNMRVLVLAIWSEISSSDLHQMYQTPNVIPQNTGSSESDLHR